MKIMINGDDGSRWARFCAMQECANEATHVYEGRASLGQRIRVCKEHHEHLTAPPKMPGTESEIPDEFPGEWDGDDDG